MHNEALRLIRVFHDLSKSEVARRVGLSKSYVTELESGKKVVTLEVLEKYAKAFDIPVSSLMLFAEQAHAKPLEDKARKFVAKKVIRMLSWIEAITEESAEYGDGIQKSRKK